MRWDRVCTCLTPLPAEAATRSSCTSCTMRMLHRMLYTSLIRLPAAVPRTGTRHNETSEREGGSGQKQRPSMRVGGGGRDIGNYTGHQARSRSTAHECTAGPQSRRAWREGGTRDGTAPQRCVQSLHDRPQHRQRLHGPQLAGVLAWEGAGAGEGRRDGPWWERANPWLAGRPFQPQHGGGGWKTPARSWAKAARPHTHAHTRTHTAHTQHTHTRTQGRARAHQERWQSGAGGQPRRVPARTIVAQQRHKAGGLAHGVWRDAGPRKQAGDVP